MPRLSVRPLRRAALAAVALAAVIGASAQAAITAAATPTPAPAMDARATDLTRMLASRVLDQRVVGADGRSVGEVEDLIVDMTTGKVRYALLEFDPGVLAPEKLYAVPVTALGLNGPNGALTYREVTRAQLEKAALDRADWKRTVDHRGYLDGLDRAYGQAPAEGTARAIRASELVGGDVENRAGREIGEIKDLVIDMKAGQVRYAVLAFDPGWFAGEKLFAFPVDAFKLVAGKDDDFVLDVDQRTVAAMKNFDANRWGTPADLARDDRINAVPGTLPRK